MVVVAREVIMLRNIPAAVAAVLVVLVEMACCGIPQALNGLEAVAARVF